MNANVTSLTARRRSAIVEDAVASIHAGAIADFLTAAFDGDRAAMQAVLDRARQLDAKHGGNLVDQLLALRSSRAA